MPLSMLTCDEISFGNEDTHTWMKEKKVACTCLPIYSVVYRLWEVVDDVVVVGRNLNVWYAKVVEVSS